MGVTDSSTGCCNQTLSLEDSFKESNHILKQQAKLKLRGLKPTTLTHGKMSTDYIYGRGSIDDYGTTSASEGEEGGYDHDDSFSGYNNEDHDGIIMIHPNNKDKQLQKIPPAFSSNLSVSESHSKEIVQDEMIANLNKQYQEKLNEHKLEAAMLQRENERLRQQNKLLKTKYSKFNEKHRNSNSNKNAHKNNSSSIKKLPKQYRAQRQSTQPNRTKTGSVSKSQSSHQRQSTPFKAALRINLPSNKNRIKSAPINLGQSTSTKSRTPKHGPITPISPLHTNNGYDYLHKTQKSAPISADHYYNAQQKRRSQVISPLVLPLPPLTEFPNRTKSDPSAIELKPTFAESPDPSDNEEWIIQPDIKNDTPFKSPLALTRSTSDSVNDLVDASAQIEDQKGCDVDDDDNQILNEFIFSIEFDGDCDSVITCVAIKRVIETLRWYSDCNGNADTLLRCIREQNYGYNLIKDYHHIMRKHLNSKCVDKIRAEIHEHVKKCSNTRKCGGFQRKCIEIEQNNTDKKKQNKRGRKKKRNKDKKDRHEHIPFYVECMDTIHCYFMHNIIPSQHTK